MSSSTRTGFSSTSSGVFSIAYLTRDLHVNRTVVLLGVMAAALLMVITIPFFGRLSDKVGGTRCYFWDR